MSEANAQRSMVAVCPHCRKTYSVRQEHVGRMMPCRQCGKQFKVALEPPPAPPAPVTAPEGALLCPVCQSAVNSGEAVKACPACSTKHHVDCWEYNRGCGLYGCKECPETEKLQDIEIPASYWGQTEKTCPNCRQVIQGAAVRCRHCGTTFESARPQETSEFMLKEREKQSLVGVRRVGVIFLVLALLPCTAPLAAVAGTIWYFAVRGKISQLPPLQATVCRMAVGIAWTVTIIMVVIGTIYSFSSGGKT